MAKLSNIGEYLSSLHILREAWLEGIRLTNILFATYSWDVSIDVKFILNKKHESQINCSDVEELFDLNFGPQ